MPKPNVETLSVGPLLDLHKYLTEILRNNGLLPNVSQIEQQKIAAILDTVVKIQT